MADQLPTTAHETLDWTWEQFAPFLVALRDRDLDAANVEHWLREWSQVSDLISETYARLYNATMRNTADADAEQRYHRFLSDIYPQAMAAEQALKQKLITSGLEPEGFTVPLRAMRAEADLFREANLPLLTEEHKLANQYNKIIAAQTVEWQGEEVTLPQLEPVYHDTNRDLREQAWQLASQRQLADREAINDLWRTFMDLRGQVANNTDLADYRDYAWINRGRFDYTPEDSLAFHRAIEEVAVPAATRVYERRRQRLGVDTLRPWDINGRTADEDLLRPFADSAEFETKTAAVFNQVDTDLGGYFETMRHENLLDLENRKNKAPGGYCMPLPAEQRPFIFMNAVGLATDVRVLLHEGGHAFHVFETAQLPYTQQRTAPMEFAEVASMAMELLASPYLTTEHGGFYSQPEAARSRIEHLEGILLFWPYMAVVDAFQHWVYTNHAAASDPANCDQKWGELWQRFMPGVNWSGLDDAMVTGWHRKLHIHVLPFYYIEYGLAQLGAVQVWRNALDDQTKSVARYREALALGNTVPLPDLYTAAGAKLAFDAETLRQAVTLVEEMIDELAS